MGRTLKRRGRRPSSAQGARSATRRLAAWSARGEWVASFASSARRVRGCGRANVRICPAWPRLTAAREADARERVDLSAVHDGARVGGVLVFRRAPRRAARARRASRFALPSQSRPGACTLQGRLAARTACLRHNRPRARGHVHRDGSRANGRVGSARRAPESGTRPRRMGQREQSVRRAAVHGSGRWMPSAPRRRRRGPGGMRREDGGRASEARVRANRGPAARPQDRRAPHAARRAACGWGGPPAPTGARLRSSPSGALGALGGLGARAPGAN